MLLGGSRRVSVSGLPVHGARIHRPLLRQDTLSRERLNGWLDRATVGRVVLIVAEAGYGKTTLLADWSRHTSRRTVWYRLEPDDRDWLTFLRHLVGSGTEVEASFAPETLRLLTGVGPGGPTQAMIVDALLRELAQTAANDPYGFTFIFDDYHHIDGSEDTNPIVKAIIEATGPGLSVVIASRSTPRLPLGRLRARGAVARMDAEALCFDHAEADRLFRDAYHRPLDPDVIEDLLAHTEGWAALLSLVRTSIEERADADVRLITQHLHGARSDVYEYLAEEVIGGLPARLQQFLMRVSILEAVHPLAARVADRDCSVDCERLIEQGENLGLLARSDDYSAHRFHPLVKDFLLDRLTTEVGLAEIRQRHLAVARQFEGIDWRIAAAHYTQAGDHDGVERVLDGALDEILASGRSEEAQPFVRTQGDAATRSVALIIRSRLELARGNTDVSVSLAETAARVAVHSRYHAGAALLNLASVMGVTGFTDDAVDYVRRALSYQLTRSQREIAQATVAMWEASRQGDLAGTADLLARLAERQEEDGHRHYVAVTRLNLAAVLYWVGNVSESLAQSTEAELLLAQAGADGVELVSAQAARASALAYLGRFREAEETLTKATESRSPHGREEALLERARVLAQFGLLDRATTALDAAGDTSSRPSGMAALWALLLGEIALRRADTQTAQMMVNRLIQNPCNDIAGALRTKILGARVSIMAGDPSGLPYARDVVQHAETQRSRPGRILGELLVAIADGRSQIGATISQLGPDEAPLLSLIAEELAANLHRLTPDAERHVIDACIGRPGRWTSALRLAVSEEGPSRLSAASLLAQVGAASDLPVLRGLASEVRTVKPLAVTLARRVAPRVFVNDLGPVSVAIGSHPYLGGVRRKVMGLLCFLLSRPSMAATRDEALEALWPDLGPDTASNSLNQTIYFLRRIFEPDYREGFSAGYLRFDGDMVTLDSELIDSVSRHCRRLLTRANRSPREAALELAGQYTGRFALDFAYEEWSVDYRETLHAAVLAFVEGMAREGLKRQDYETAIALTQAMLAVDPDADSMELTLLRAYRASGRHAAAAELYAHYATVQREQLGVEPPLLDEL